MASGPQDHQVTSDDSQKQESAQSSLDLNALLSPVRATHSHDSLRDSHSQQTTPTADDARFSTVLLGSALDEADEPVQSHDAENNIETGGIATIAEDDNSSDPRASITAIPPRRGSTGSDTTKRSSTNVPFLLHRLDQEEGHSETAEHRGSLQGHLKLQEEFSRMQSEKQRLDDEKEKTDADIDWEFWGAVMADYHQFARDRSEDLARAIEQGVPHALRGMMWQLMAASKDLELETTYANLLKESSPHEKAILRDLGRTFPHHEFFMDGSGIGQENLFNVLKAYSLYDRDVGYCQGLPFIVAILLLNMPDEEAFCLLVRLMYSYGLRGHFLPEMPGLQLRLFQFDRLLEEMLPVLHVHFLRQGVKSSMFASQWFLTLFSYRFPLEVVFRIFDNCLATGIEAIFRFSLVLLEKNETELLKLKFDEILSFLKNRLFEQYRRPSPEHPKAMDVYLVDQFVESAFQTRITPFMLDSYAHEYEEMVRIRDAHAAEIDTLRNANRLLTEQVKKLDSSLAQINAEHCEIVKELVMARLKNEELEGELVRYKLLYADLMHQNADALSSHRLSTAGTSNRR
ncbi:RabGAP/TBC [Sistotremastrum suecicum HHB10207 ss-3]|uniref:RabGAP/TBC n=1 Tax=Sistotremastrum suecicum HHB10207 ss-3 TaxID=1314776 RepID=A0A166GAQ8_9AGAM|nr:RabGAP/TBC [Sistotremastrum suecicum HHB10207 ss-3]